MLLILFAVFGVTLSTSPNPPLGEGESCLMDKIDAECGNKLHCNPLTFKCERRTCAMEVSEKVVLIKTQISSGKPYPRGVHIPSCDKDGSYSMKQCIGSRCLCVSAEGDPILNYSAARWEADDMDCKCASAQHEYMKSLLIGKMFRCSSNGNYEKIRCSGDVCFCADEKGDMITGSKTVELWEKNSLTC